jgi:predicted metal-dependent peptidase
VEAIILEEREFLDTLKQCNRETQIKEYGKIVSDEMVYGFLSETPKGSFVIFVRSTIDSLDEVLEHELRHIYFEHLKKW